MQRELLNATAILAIIVFLATYAVIGFGKLPGLRLDRAGAALIGASLMLACGVLSPEEAYKAIDLDTLVLLLGMMIVVAHLRVSGLFRVVSGWVARHARRPVALLATVILVSGLFSAFLVNDAVCIALAPLVFELATSLKRNPVPYLLAVAMASNVGSAATITGNPQNIMIGSFSRIPYGNFAAALSPIAAIGLCLTFGMLVLFFRNEFLKDGKLQREARRVHYSKPLARKSLLVTVSMIAAFFLGQPVSKAAIVAAALLLITRRVKPGKIYREIDFPLLMLFAGLFIVVAGIEKAVLTRGAFAYAKTLHLERVSILTAVSALLSNLVSNVPAVLVLKPFVLQLNNPQHAWLTLAMSSTLAGNFTILGSVANLIVVQRARRDGVEISFWDYFKVGAPLTVLTLIVGIVFLR
ncbi:MAG: anion transporter [Acidobacteriota bacterium]|nr:anion transporter [Acidobacteriota bacterium]